jgi:hypothetical protein
MLLIFLISALLPFAAAAIDPERGREPVPTPMMRVVEPAAAKAGDDVLVKGDYLGENLVAEVYLTDGKANLKVEVLSQSDKEIKFKVPAEAKPGAYRLMVLTTGVEPMLIEEPVRFVVQE